jgi:hypothetical protein
MDKLLKRWIKLSVRGNDEGAMQEMAEHAIGRELLVDYDRYQEHNDVVD